MTGLNPLFHIFSFLPKHAPGAPKVPLFSLCSSLPLPFSFPLGPLRALMDADPPSQSLHPLHPADQNPISVMRGRSLWVTPQSGPKVHPRMLGGEVIHTKGSLSLFTHGFLIPSGLPYKGHPLYSSQHEYIPIAANTLVTTIGH